MKPLIKLGDSYLNVDQIVYVKPLTDGSLHIMTTGRLDDGRQHFVRVQPAEVPKVISALDAYVGAHAIFAPQ
jgi:hypothetical protein